MALKERFESRNYIESPELIVEPIGTDRKRSVKAKLSKAYNIWHISLKIVLDWCRNVFLEDNSKERHVYWNCATIRVLDGDHQICVRWLWRLLGGSFRNRWLVTGNLLSSFTNSIDKLDSHFWKTFLFEVQIFSKHPALLEGCWPVSWIVSKLDTETVLHNGLWRWWIVNGAMHWMHRNAKNNSLRILFREARCLTALISDQKS